jgi:hypothetical protein
MNAGVMAVLSPGRFKTRRAAIAKGGIALCPLMALFARSRSCKKSFGYEGTSGLGGVVCLSPEGSTSRLQPDGSYQITPVSFELGWDGNLPIQECVWPPYVMLIKCGDASAYRE